MLRIGLAGLPDWRLRVFDSSDRGTAPRGLRVDFLNMRHAGLFREALRNHGGWSSFVMKEPQ